MVEERTSAILHGDQRLQQLGSISDESISNTSSPSQGLSRNAKNSARPSQKPSRTGRRKIEIILKDEDYLRTRMPIPTAIDYPELGPEIFKFPRLPLQHAFGGAKYLFPNFSTIEGSQAFRCVIRFTLNEERLVCIGESQRKVL